MKLSFEQIKSLAFGYATAVPNGENGVSFFRMSEAQAKAFEQCDMGVEREFYMKALSTSSIMLDFETDSEYFSFGYENAIRAASRLWYYFEILLDGKSVASVGEERFEKCVGEYRLDLPQGTHRITVVFPALFRADIRYLSLSDGASFVPVEKTEKVLFHGDSITQGYDAKRPSLSYVNRLALRYNFEAYNLGIGAALFDETMLVEPDFTPDKIVVSYGTNHWGHQEKNLSIQRCEGFFRRLRELYPTQPLLYILPIVRLDAYSDTDGWQRFLDFRTAFDEIAKRYGATVVETIDFIPAQPQYFTDGLHPNEDGFEFYAKGVAQAAKEFFNA